MTDISMYFYEYLYDLSYKNICRLIFISTKICHLMSVSVEGFPEAL